MSWKSCLKGNVKDENVHCFLSSWNYQLSFVLTTMYFVGKKKKFLYKISWHTWLTIQSSKKKSEIFYVQANEIDWKVKQRKLKWVSPIALLD